MGASVPAPDLRDSIIHVPQTIARCGGRQRVSCGNMSSFLNQKFLLRFPAPGSMHPLFSKAVGSEILQRFSWPAARTILIEYAGS
jgi:hypothetical protein